MFPRLTPRRSPRRSPLTGSITLTRVNHESPFSAAAMDPGIEMELLADPANDSSPTSTYMRPSVHAPSPLPPPLQQHNPNLHKRRTLPNKASWINAPLSPSPNEQQFDPMKSPCPTQILSGTPSSNSDFSVTPPATGPRPLVVSAKRLGQDMRRKHSKRRRRRREATTNGNNNGFCLWKEEGDEASTPHPESSDEDADVRERLPFLFDRKEVSPIEKTKHYWEWCYGKGTTIELNSDAWSAKRAPPTKGCLSNKKLRRKPSPATAFKSPPTSPEELEEIRKSSLSKQKTRVQFGSPQAAEYEVDGPPGHLTPLPNEVTRKRYSMDQKKKTEVEEEITQETKENNTILAEWEQEFDEPRSSSRRKRRDRRSSSLFTPSPMLVERNANGDADSSDNTPPREPLASSVPSPSILVMENLASLRMGSPAKDADSTSKSLLTAEKSSVEATASESPAVVSCDQHADTVQFGVSLQSVNSTGGAMDITPPRSDTPHSSTTSNVTRSADSQADATPPPTNVSLETIHSVGGALDLASPASPCQPSLPHRHSPISRMSDSSENGTFEVGSFEAANHAASTDIVKTMLKTPGLDQEWESADVFRNLAKRRTKSPIQYVLESIESCQNGILACMDDLKVKAKYSANTKSNTKFKLPAKEIRLAQQIVSREWKQLEVEFLGDLTQVIERTMERVTSLSNRATDLKLPSSMSKTKPKSCIGSLQSKISDLEEKIRRERALLELTEAAEAPFAAVHCQATSHLGVCGFRLDEYTGDSLQLSYEHLVEGIESRFVFDLNIGSLTGSRIADAPKSSQQLISTDHVAGHFHEHFLKELVNGTHPFMQKLEPLELQESILALSRWLGRLDLAAKDLEIVADRSSVVLELPTVKFVLSDGLHIQVNYDQSESSSGSFLPSTVFVTQPGKPKMLQELPSDITTANCMQKLFEIYA